MAYSLSFRKQDLCLMLSLFPLNNTWLWCLNIFSNSLDTDPWNEKKFHRSAWEKSCHSSSFSFAWLPLPIPCPLETIRDWSLAWDFIRSYWITKICKSHTKGHGTSKCHLYMPWTGMASKHFNRFNSFFAYFIWYLFEKRS